MDKLRIVEIELFSYCNRKCGWCPNSYIDRESDCEFLDKDILEKVLKELAQHDYKGVFSFSRYNEPFSNFEYFNECLRLVREYFPYNKLVTNTNGDYLTKEILEETLIDELTIMDYDCNGIFGGMNRFKEWGIENITLYPHYITGTKGHLSILYYFNWPKDNKVTDRGGLLPQYSKSKREKICLEPQYFIGINYDGTVSPCCNIRSDCEKHEDYILGSLYQNSLEEILSSPGRKHFQQLTAIGSYSKNMPCYYCDNNGGRYTTGNGLIYKN